VAGPFYLRNRRASRFRHNSAKHPSLDDGFVARRLVVMAEALESRRLLSTATVPAGDAIPFKQIVIDQNPGTTPVVKLLVDIDNNGKEDAVVGHEANLGGGGLDIYEFPASGNPADHWNEISIDSTADVYESIRAANVSGNVDSHGNPVNDLVVNERGTIYWYENPLGLGENPYTTPWTRHLIGYAQQGATHEMYIADLTGVPGQLDVIDNTTIFFENSPTSWTQIATANYNRTEKGLYLFNSGSGLGAIDLLGTGDAPNYQVGWYENPRDYGGNAETGQWIFHPIGPAYGNYVGGDGVSYAAMDITGDGQQDIITCDGENGENPPYLTGGLIWWQAPANDLTGTWTPHVIDSSITDVHNLVLADLNNDGQEEILAFEQDQSPQGRLLIIYNEGGTGQNWLEQTLASDSDPALGGGDGGHNESVGDATGDGYLDILTSPHGFYTQINPISLYVNEIPSEGITAPVVTTSPVSQSVNTDGSVTFSVAATGTGPLTYQWQVNGLNISGATASSYTLAAAPASDNGNVYRCIVGNPAGLVPSGIATLTVSGAPVADTTPPTAALTSAQPLSTAIDAAYTFTVTFSDNVAVAAGTLGNGNLTVTGNGYSESANLVSTGLENGPTVVATYSVPAPAGGWSSASDGSYNIALNANQISDTSGNFAVAVADLGNFTVNIPVPATGGTLAGSQTTAAASYNLTTLGTSDWAHWGLGGNVYNFDHDASGGSQISNVTDLGTGLVGGYSSSSRSVSWTNGTPIASQSGDDGYIWANTVLGTGFSFTVPASTTERTVYVYAGGYSSGATLTATLSDGSATPFIATASGSGLYTDLFTITFAAASAGQDLTITYVKSSNINGTGGSVDLIAAALAGAAAPVADTTPPTAALTSATALTTASSAPYDFTVTYSDNVSVLASSLDNGNLLVTANGYSHAASLVSTGLQNGSTIVATYSVPAPAGGWSSTSDGSYNIALLANQVSDTSGNFAAAVVTLGTFTVNIPVAATGGSLAGSQATAASAYNLTALGTSDWAHWGRGGVYGNFDHDATGGSQISNVTVLGSGAVGGYSDPSRSVSWSNGSPTADDSADDGYIWANTALGAGFSFTVPASTATQTLYVYAGGYSSGATLTATLSDSSASPYIATASGTGHYNELFTITFSAASAGQKLTITYVKSSNINGTSGSVDLIAAALAGAPLVDTTPPKAALQSIATITSAASPVTLNVNYSDNVAVSAASLKTGNLTISGPTSQTADFLSASPSSSAAAITGTYAIAPPAGGWTSADNGTYTVSLASDSVSDTSNNFAAGAVLGTFTIDIPTGVVGTGSITGSSVAAATNYNLTTLGTSDWAHWGLHGVYGNFDHDATGGSQISNVTVLGSGTVTGGALFGRSSVWTNGSPLASDAGDWGYYSASGAIGAGFSFTAPADTTTRTLYVYAGGDASSVTLTATLSDGSAAPVVLTSSGTGEYQDLFKITYTAASAGQTLTISYVNSGGTGSADLMSAALQVG
jgi:hypothetical protein